MLEPHSESKARKDGTARLFFGEQEHKIACKIDLKSVHLMVETDNPGYEWDEAKSAETLRRRGFGFEIMHGFLWEFAFCATIEVVDGEEREKWLGPISGSLYMAVVTMRDGETIRVISLRRATRDETALWRRETGQ